MPPIDGPRAAAAVPSAPHTPTAVPCWRLGKAPMRIERETGIIIAPPIPWPTRAAISQSIVGANPQNSENTVNSTRPVVKTNFCPNLSAMRPMERKSAAMARL